MRIIILGANPEGLQLANRLCAEKNDVVLVDKNRSRLRDAENQLDILTLHGAGSNPEVLESAGINQATMLVALTESDETNILACMLAHQAGVKYTVASIEDTEYAVPTPTFDLRKMGIDLLVSKQLECAEEMYNIIQIPGAQEAVDMFDGQVLCTGFKIPTDSPLLLAPLAQAASSELLDSVRLIAYVRHQEIEVPNGTTQFMIGDDVYLTGEPASVRAFVSHACPEEHRFNRIIVAGGGRTGLHLCKLLEKENKNVTLLEGDPIRAEYCSEQLDKVLVVSGNALEKEAIHQIGVNENTAFIAATGSDENNIMSCLIAEKLGAHFTIAKVNNPDYAPLVISLNLIDRAISPHSSLINSIFHFARGRNVKADTSLQKIPGEVLELYLGPEHPWLDQKLRDIKAPAGVIVAMVQRNDQILVATGDLELHLNDTLLVFSLVESLKKLNALFN